MHDSRPAFDIHRGSTSSFPPRNEVVQSESFTASNLHVLVAQGLLTKDGKKISKVGPRDDRPDERPASGARVRHPPRSSPHEPLSGAPSITAVRLDEIARASKLLQEL